MIERYTRPEMGAIWTEQNKYNAWLEVEILACEAWAEIGDIPKEDTVLLRKNASFDVNRILEIDEKVSSYVKKFRLDSEIYNDKRKEYMEYHRQNVFQG